jgi:hypothetical protein
MIPRRGLPSRLVHAWALGLYALVAVVFNWPLVLALNTSLPGPIGGDTGVYVWNLWLFRHEVVAHGRFPLFTHEILALTPPVDLSLHNYTLFADALAFPLIPLIGVTATFNVLYLVLSALTAWSMFVLARSIGVRSGEAWVAGLLFGFSPILMARSSAHFSLATAVPLPLFVLALRRAERTADWRWTVACGAIAGWASLCDAYYGIFCIVIAACYFTTRYVRMRINAHRQRFAGAARFVDALIVCAGAVIVFVLATGGRDIRVFSQTIALRTLYNPVLIITVLLMVRALLHFRPVMALMPPPRIAIARFIVVAAAACALLLSPVLYAFRYSVADGATLHGPSYWRSTPAGVDLLALFTPNPNHALFGGPWRAWLTTRPNGFEENVASVTLVGVAVVAVAVLRYRFRPRRVWVVLTMFLGAMALGPFVHVAGINTFVPGPWAVLRYLPIVTATRMPARYAIPMTLTFSVVFALALARITSRHPAYRRAIIAFVGVALLFELTPYRRALYSARVPDVFRIIANDPRDVRVLELPLGFRDGESSAGNFTAASQFYQTFHQKRLIGGYLSRISAREKDRQRVSITVRRLLRLSEGQRLSRAALDEVKRRAPGFVDRARVGYVVIDVARTPPELRDFAIEAYRLLRLGASDGFEVYAPTVGTTTATLR